MRRNIYPRQETEQVLDEAAAMVPAEVPHFDIPNAARESKSLTITSPPIQAKEKKLRANDTRSSALDSDHVISLSGVKAGTSDAISLCRGDLKGASIWEYFQVAATATTWRRRALSTAPRSSNLPCKSVCVASGRCRPSAVCRLRPSSVPCVDDDDSLDGNPLTAGSSPWKIEVADTTSNKQNVDHEVHLPLIVRNHDKEMMVNSGNVKLLPPNFNYFGDTPRSRRPSIDSASTAVSESDHF